MAFYRKYRPKKLSDLIGQDINVEILRNAAILNRLSHAYLFYGERGSGKTSTARILAKIANCETRLKDELFRKTGEPCNSCPACLSIDAGNAIDLTEIDAASNRGIDEIRNLQESVRLSPSSFRYKTFIIDEVHMLTPSAWNALLKTIEEPPSHALFILATTEIEKVPLTIRSRAQKFLFSKLPKNLIIGKLKAVASSENISLEEPVFELLAGASEGSMRDAETMFDQIVSFLGKNETITLEKAESVVGKVSLEKMNYLARFLLEKDIEQALEFAETLKNENCDIVQFNKDFINYLGKVLSLKANPKMESAFRNIFSENELEKMKKLSELSSIESHIKLLKLLISAHREMRYSPFAFIPFEVALVEFTKS
ncbi:MAG: DNA polymerase III subunit gamma/tau [Candidatus Paceibacterota bacterium]